MVDGHAVGGSGLQGTVSILAIEPKLLDIKKKMNGLYDFSLFCCLTSYMVVYLLYFSRLYGAKQELATSYSSGGKYRCNIVKYRVSKS